MRRGRRQHLRTLLLLAAGAALTALTVGAYEANVGRPVELDTVDQRFSIRGKEQPPNDVAVVAIDDVTFSDLDTRWPFPRTYHARVVDNLRKAGAEVIGYDVQFTEPSVDPREDLALFNAARRAGNLVFATTEVDRLGRSNVLGGDSNLRSIRAVAGNSLLVDDPGGVIRRVNPSTEGLESFAFAAARRVKPGARLPRHTTWIDYAGPPGTIDTIPFSKVYLGRFNPDRVRGKLVFVGPTAPTLQDVHPTSVAGDQQMGGAEIQANSAATLLEGAPLDVSPGGLNVLLIVLLGMLVPVASIRLTPLRGIAVALIVAAGYLVGAQIAFNDGLILPVIYPLGALTLTSISSLGVHYFTETRERRRLRALFGRFVPESVVDQVVDRADDDLRLVGEEMEATVLFIDLRGFTTFSETLDPPRVFDILNLYHEEMSHAVLDNGGTLVAYLGDGLMAVFGAPIEQADHADRALRTGLEMIGPRLDRFNDQLEQQGLPRFRMGVGINSGEVMSGNVGSARRLEYSTIGDTVNTASRIESMTKDTPHMLLMSKSTREALTEHHEGLVRVGERAVRGREQAIELWTIADDDSIEADTPSEPAKEPA